MNGMAWMTGGFSSDPVNVKRIESSPGSIEVELSDQIATAAAPVSGPAPSVKLGAVTLDGSTFSAAADGPPVASGRVQPGVVSTRVVRGRAVNRRAVTGVVKREAP